MPVSTADSVKARRLWLESSDFELRFRYDSALVRLRAAQQADPTFYPAHQTYIRIMRYLAQFDALREEYRARPLPEPIGSCLRLVTAARLGDDAASAAGLNALQRKYGPTPCLAHALASALPAATRPAERAGVSERTAEAAVRHAGDIADVWIHYANLLAASGRAAQARAAYTRGLARMQHPLDRFTLDVQYQDLLVRMGDTISARTRWRVLAAAAERDARPGMRYQLMVNGAPPRSANEHRLRRLAAADLARRHGAAVPELQARMFGASLELDAGDPNAALRHFDRSVQLADSLGNSFFQLITRRLRGRAYAKLGRLVDARRELEAGIAAGATEPLELAEAYHNLAHAYEGEGNLRAAARAADQFIAMTRPFRYLQPRMMSLHDAGIIRWKAGWHAAADAAYREMVTVVDEQDANHYWAGEYYERTGDLRRALRYYERGLAAGGDPSLNLGGMTRVLDAIGLRDSAEVMARRHDQAITNQLDVPLLPAVLARHGRTNEAIATARSWFQRRSKAGSVQGAAMAGVQLANLLIDARRWAEALASARETERLARRLNLIDEVIESLRLSGIAQARLGRRDSAAIVLRQAAQLARARPTSMALISTHVALGDHYADSNRRKQALQAYDQAARAVESVSVKLEIDQDRVRYRALNLAPFDGAMRTLREPPHDIDALLRWSERRKAAALSMASERASNPNNPALLDLAGVTRRLRANEALLDFSAVNGSIAVTVITTRAARLLRLPAPADTTAALAERLRKPMAEAHQGRLDLARARFDRAAAATLYRSLILPVEPWLTGVSRLLIVPDGPLHYVPFDALVTDAAGNYLIDRYEVVYLPAAHYLPRERTPVGGLSLLAVSHSAPGSDREVDLISRAWPRAIVTQLRTAQATETRVLQHARQHAILHFATHAVANDRDPLASHLRLAGDAAADGFLHVSEIAAARRPARLVVLSACETLRGPLFAGEGFMGVARAFLVSGAAGVVATAWPIGPQTADLMEVFYRNMARGEMPSTALRNARLLLRSQPATAHPFFWGGIAIIGH